MLRFTDVKRNLSAIGVQIKRTGFGAECKVYPYSARNIEAVAYYSDDLDDCLLTGNRMARQERSTP
jgi:hypothetical protein